MVTSARTRNETATRTFFARAYGWTGGRTPPRPAKLRRSERNAVNPKVFEVAAPHLFFGSKPDVPHLRGLHTDQLRPCRVDWHHVGGQQLGLHGHDIVDRDT